MQEYTFTIGPVPDGNKDKEILAAIEQLGVIRRALLKQGFTQEFTEDFILQFLQTTK